MSTRPQRRSALRIVFLLVIVAVVLAATSHGQAALWVAAAAAVYALVEGLLAWRARR
ncbi:MULTISPECIES: hypothetical protein [Sinomonas]